MNNNIFNLESVSRVDRIVAGTLEGQWIAGMLDRPSGLVTTIRTPGTPPTNDQTSLVFHLNGKPFSRWYYDWKSGANKTQRLLKHVLKTYIVERCAVDMDDNFASFTSLRAFKQLYRVLYVVTSPEFTIVSYRRAPSDQYQADLVSSQLLQGEEDIHMSATEDTRSSHASTTAEFESTNMEVDHTKRERQSEEFSVRLSHT